MDTLKFTDYRSLDIILQEFDRDGEYAADGDWSIAKGGYDLDFEICHNGIPVIGAIKNELHNYTDKDIYQEVIKLVQDYYPDYKSDEVIEATISFKIKINKDDADEIARIVDHHLDYLVSFDEWPEILEYYDATINVN